MLHDVSKGDTPDHPRPFRWEGRGEGSRALPPHPIPLPHEDVVKREIFLSVSSRRELKPLAFEARVI